VTRIAIVGAAGQLGTAIRRQLEPTNVETIAFDRSTVDIVDADSVAEALDAVRPDLVINTAAYNHVDRAEDDPLTAFQVNAIGPRNLAIWCEAAGAALVHVSTDYVFSGCEPDASEPEQRRGWQEGDAPNPESAYGIGKLAGEYFVRSLCRRHFVVRTCGLYGSMSGSKGNFVETMLRVGAERPLLRVVNDQHCTPTSTADLAAALIALSETDAYGLYHATNSGRTTWHAFAVEIFRQANMNVDVQPISTAEYGAKAHRPAFSVLDCGRLASILGTPLPAWQDALSRYLTDRTSP
jgi:dTDP-4-dehydrorhamnose reductase